MTEYDFKKLVKKHMPLISKVCKEYHIEGYTNNDKIQECLLALWGSIDNYDDTYKISTYIATVCRYNFNNILRKQTRQNEERGSRIINNFNFDFIENGVDNGSAYEKSMKQLWNLVHKYKKSDIIIELLENNKSQYRLAKDLGVSKQYISQVYNDFKEYVKESWVYENNE
jgi:RNA polymerase sigma factor (sigma-70 family)